MSDGRIVHEAGEARALVTALVEDRPGGIEAALAAVGRSVGLTKWGAWKLYHGRRKSVGYGTLTALRRAYITQCERQVAKLEAELRILREMGQSGDALTSLDNAASRLADEIREARRRSG